MHIVSSSLREEDDTTIGSSLLKKVRQGEAVFFTEGELLVDGIFVEGHSAPRRLLCVESNPRGEHRCQEAPGCASTGSVDFPSVYSDAKCSISSRWIKM
jgi:hypothetical protein